MGIKYKNLSNILFSKTRQRVLGLLYGQPNKDFYTNEIIKHSHIGSGAVQRELEQLSSVGLITVHISGNQKRYQANQASPIYNELRSITLKTFGLADVLQQTLEPLSNKVLIAFIYGSIAKQTDTVNSDIDIMLIGNDLTYSDFFSTITKIESKLERKINPTFHTPQEWIEKINKKNNFITKILNQPKIFIVGTEDELQKLK